jgi:mono/diheme cytochrome c family protein
MRELHPIFGAVCVAILATLPRPAAAGDPASGEALYVGTKAFANGGAPCLACHGIAGHGLARAASFGPDLTASHGQYGAEALDSVLEEVAFPSMEPIYRGRVLTKEERADLVAFLAAADGAKPAQLGAGFGAGVVLSMGVFLAGVVLVGRRGKSRRGSAASGQGR